MVLDLIEVTWQRKKFRQTEMAPMALSDSEVTNDKSCSKSCLKNYKALKKQYDDLLVKLDDTGHKEYQMGLLRAQLEKVKQEKEGFEFKITKFEKSAKDLDQLLASQITDKSKKEPDVNEYGPRDSILKPTIGCEKESDNYKKNTDDSLEQHIETSSVKEEEPKKARENNDALIIEDWVSDDEDEVEPIPKVEKKIVIPTATEKEFAK
ncbi:hypothetical protein Tco_0075361, partial [Tanacetum coccineum]